MVTNVEWYLKEETGGGKKVKRLYRSRQDSMIAGICGGIGEYMEIDPVIIRLLWLLATILSFGIGVIGYLVAWIIIPREGTSDTIQPPQ